MPNKAWGDDFEIMLFGADEPRPPFVIEGGYAVIEICGPLAQTGGYWGESYDEIRTRAVAAFASAAPSVCLKIDSPGGDYGGALELSGELRAMALASGKSLKSFTKGMALSAGYALACAGSEIVMTPSAQVGSVGVWAPMVDVTVQDAMYGVKYAVASSGKAKNDRNPHTGITDEAFARLQAQIDDMALHFFTLVADQRPALSVPDVKALEGAEFFGVRGVNAGLADRIVNSWQAFLDNEEGSPMAVKASAVDEARGLLQKASEGDDDDAKKAKKLLKAFEEPSEEDKKKKEDDEKAAAAKAEDDKKKEDDAKALASNAVALATEVANLRAKDAARDLADAKAKATAELDGLFAKRPDLSEAQRKALSAIPFAQAEALVASWPRVSAQPGAAAKAMTAAVTGGEIPTGGPVLRHTDEERAILARLDVKSGPAPRAEMRAGNFTTPFMTPEQAHARLAELAKETV